MEDDLDIDNEHEDSFEHVDSEKCQCYECQCAKNLYVQIIDVARYINNLNDWD